MNDVAHVNEATGDRPDPTRVAPSRIKSKSVTWRALRVLFGRRKRNKTSLKLSPDFERHENEAIVARWTRRVGWFTLALVIAAMVSNIIIWLQFSVMSEQLKDSRLESLAQSELTRSSLAIANQTMVATQRAWLEPAGAQADWRSDGADPSLRVWVTVKNTGHEPALGFNFLTRTHNRDLPPARPDGSVDWTDASFWKTLPVTLCSTVEPRLGSQITFPGGVSLIDSKPLKDAKRVSATAEGTSVFVLTGCIAYVSLAEVRKSGFCFYLQPERGVAKEAWSTLRSCPVGNTAS